MAESRSSEKTMSKSSETLPDVYCDPCHDVEGIVCQGVAFCDDCTECLCYDCLSVHKKLKITRNHQIDQKKQRKGHNYNAEDCHRHKGETIQSYCRSCDHLCCNVCQNVDHHACELESLTSASADIKDSKQLKSLDTKLIALKKGYAYNLRKAESQTLDIDTHYAKAIKEMKKLYEAQLKKSKEKISLLKKDESSNKAAIHEEMNAQEYIAKEMDHFYQIGDRKLYELTDFNKKFVYEFQFCRLL